MNIIHSYQFLDTPKFKLSKNKNNIINENNEKIIGLLNIPNTPKLFSVNIKKIKNKKKFNIIISIEIDEKLKYLIKYNKNIPEKKKLLVLIKKNNTINPNQSYKYNIKTINYLFLESVLKKKLHFFKHNMLNFYDIIINFNNSNMFLKNNLSKEIYLDMFSFNIIFTKHLINIFNLDIFKKETPVLVITEQEHIKHIKFFLKEKRVLVIRDKKDKIDDIKNYDYIIINNSNDIKINEKWKYVIYIFVKKISKNYECENNLFIINNIDFVDECYRSVFKDTLIYNYKKIMNKCIFKIKGNCITEKFDIDNRITNYISNNEILLYNIIEEGISNYKLVNNIIFKNKFPRIYNKFSSHKECNICFRPINETNMSFLECGHYYCTDCLNINSKINSKCPECRTNYSYYYKLNYSNKVRFLQNLNYTNIIIVSENQKILKLLSTILYSSVILKSDNIKPKKNIILPTTKIILWSTNLGLIK